MLNPHRRGVITGPSGRLHGTSPTIEPSALPGIPALGRVMCSAALVTLATAGISLSATPEQGPSIEVTVQLHLGDATFG
ncbi:hypothetical protein [Streptomyces alfalfae]|uniref:Uncharacterized protein n=1 Tax=Streptomyces alfalfae TaxID=1642299 RepID=A0A7T4U0T8_9ACTN|nr:hypothetical protein [Streptomyces alfalfae]QQC92685.1 hypothetical protein I8755_33195 [Streptomyces alfalfae]